MYFNKHNVTKLIREQWDANTSHKLSPTWMNCKAKKDDIDVFVNFYKNRAGGGLCEPPRKYPYYPSSLSFISFDPRKYIMIPIHKQRAYAEFLLFKQLGVQFPKYLGHPLFYYNFKGEKYNPNLRKYARFYILLSQYLKWYQIKNICEIGSGYGGLTELLIANINFQKYIMIDIFETLAIAMSYLSNELNGKCKLVFLESLDELKSVAEKDEQAIVFLSTELYNQIKKDMPDVLHVDFFINSNSFVEMHPASTKDYFEFMEQYSDCYFFSYNAIKRREGDELQSALDFPYDEHWNTIFEHPLYELYGSAEYEKLTKR